MSHGTVGLRFESLRVISCPASSSWKFFRHPHRPLTVTVPEVEDVGEFLMSIMSNGIVKIGPRKVPISGLYLTLDHTLAWYEREIILAVLDKFDDNRTHAARSLGISIRALRNKINAYNADGANIAPGRIGSP